MNILLKLYYNIEIITFINDNILTLFKKIYIQGIF